ncbi:MAG: acetyl-CoA C-acyltransferase [Euryarchaeota archaeon]|nr:acetyl-CoA C-acyltransferase [Euryarchaeota archaeon]
MGMEVLVIEGARTPMGRYLGRLRERSAVELGVAAAEEAVRRSRVPRGEFNHAIFGNVLQTSGDAPYLARHIGLRAGLPIEAGALTVNRLCGSGMQAVISGAQMLLLGEADTVLAGGTEAMSQAPHVVRGLRNGLRLGDARLEDSLQVALMDTYSGCTMATTAENLARRYGITREEQDRYALRSQRAAAEAKGKLREEMAAVDGLEEDEHPNPGTTLEALSKLRPAFPGNSTVTAGNACGMVDGATALVLASSGRAEELGLGPLGRIVSWAVVGVEPTMMGIGPVPAAREALARAGLRLEDMDLVEVNEAFAAQYLAVERELDLERERTNVNGGAIALGHPFGSTGARLVLALLYELRRRRGRYGLASACIGGGQGIAMVVER